jgi:Family of unknown function (DUF6220)
MALANSLALCFVTAAPKIMISPPPTSFDYWRRGGFWPVGLSSPSVMVPPTGTMTISPALATPRRTGFFAKAHSAFGVLLLLELFAQFFFIAAAILPVAGAAGDANSTPTNNATAIHSAWINNYVSFSGLHGLNGSLLIPVTILVLILLCFAARHPWKTTGLTALLFLLVVLQVVLAMIGFSGAALVGGLHGLNALLLVGLGVSLTWQRWAF